MDTHHTKIKANIVKSNEVTTLEWLFFVWSLLFKFHHSDGKYSKKTTNSQLHHMDIFGCIAQNIQVQSCILAPYFVVLRCIVGQ